MGEIKELRKQIEVEKEKLLYTKSPERNEERLEQNGDYLQMSRPRA